MGPQPTHQTITAGSQCTCLRPISSRGACRAGATGGTALKPSLYQLYPRFPRPGLPRCCRFDTSSVSIQRWRRRAVAAEESAGAGGGEGGCHCTVTNTQTPHIRYLVLPFTRGSGSHALEIQRKTPRARLSPDGYGTPPPTLPLFDPQHLAGSRVTGFGSLPRTGANTGRSFPLWDGCLTGMSASSSCDCNEHAENYVRRQGQEVHRLESVLKWLGRKK